MEQESQRYNRGSSPALRFGCGAILGMVMGLSIVTYLLGPGWSAAAVILVSAIVGGWLVYHFGDWVLVRMLEAIFSFW